MRHFFESVWSPLAANSVLWLSVTLAAYVTGQAIQRLAENSPVANPVLIAVTLVIGVLLSSHTAYATYFAGAQIIHFLLGPATVALAVPLARYLSHVRRSMYAVGIALLAGSLTSILSGAAIVWLFGGSREIALSIAPKAATTPIAMSLSQEIGGIPPLTAAMAIAGGIVAAICVQLLMRSLRINDWRAHGFAAGVSGSGVAAARVAPLDDLAAAFAALGIGLNGLLTAVLIPILVLIWRA